MAKGNFVGQMLGNKWVKVSIYSLIIILIFWVIYLLIKRLLDNVLNPPLTPKEKQIIDVEGLNPLPDEADCELTANEAGIIAQVLQDSMSGLGTTCASMFSAIKPYRDKPNCLRLIYEEFGIRDDANLTEWFRGDLADWCINCDRGYTCHNWPSWWTNAYPCDVPNDCYNRNLNEMECMRWYWKKSELPI